MNKIAVFYHISQEQDWWWDEFFQPHMALLENTGLADALDFIDISVAAGNQPIPVLPKGCRRITYHRAAGVEENHAMLDMWRWAQDHPGYKVLWFHGIGISHRESPMKEFKRAWGRFLEFCVLHRWQECQTLLDFYDCVGADYINFASFGSPRRRYRAPHFSGTFWWANSNYIRRLDPGYLDQDVPHQRYLGELWIGSADPRVFTMCRTDVNPLLAEVKFDPALIDRALQHHLAELSRDIERY